VDGWSIGDQVEAFQRRHVLRDKCIERLCTPAFGRYEQMTTVPMIVVQAR